MILCGGKQRLASHNEEDQGLCLLEIDPQKNIDEIKRIFSYYAESLYHWHYIIDREAEKT